MKCIVGILDPFDATPIFETRTIKFKNLEELDVAIRKILAEWLETPEEEKATCYVDQPKAGAHGVRFYMNPHVDFEVAVSLKVINKIKEKENGR